MNEEKVREVLGFCYEEAHRLLEHANYHQTTKEDFYTALWKIESKIETLTADDTGEAN